MKTWNAVAAALALVLALLVATQPLYVLGLTLFDYGETPGGQYYTEQTKDSIRFPESDPAALSRLTAHAAYPPGANQSPVTVVRVPADNWQTALATSQLRASQDAAILVGDASAPNVTANATTTTVSSGDAAVVAAGLSTSGGRADDTSPNNVIIVSSEDPRWALPAAAWSAYTGDPILYASSDGIPQATTQAINVDLIWIPRWSPMMSAGEYAVPFLGLGLGVAIGGFVGGVIGTLQPIPSTSAVKVVVEAPDDRVNEAAGLLRDRGATVVRGTVTYHENPQTG